MNTELDPSRPSSAALTTGGFASQFRAAVVSTIVLVFLLCGIYPLLVWAIAQTIFPHQANGSLITGRDGKTIVGSELIGQAFTGDAYFHSRPSAAGAGYDPSSTGGTNLGPTSSKLLHGVVDDPATPDVNESFDGVAQLAAAYRKTNGLADGAILPADAVTRSASGVDPHISPANAKLQAARVAKARGMTVEDVERLIASNSSPRQLGVLGESGVNVLTLNLALDAASRK